MLRRSCALAAVLCAVVAPSARAASAGGAVYAAVAARAFAVRPDSAPVGAPLQLSFRALAPAARVSARVDFIAAGRVVAQAGLGRVPSGRVLRVGWTPPAGALPAGRYTARLVLGGSTAARAPLAVLAPAPSPGSTFTAAPAGLSAGVFPVQGPYAFGDRFGVERPGHIHQGQDIVAASGTPIVAPLAGTVLTTAYQAGGAGYYIVLHGAGGPDLVFMHLLAGSTVVAKGQSVAAGQRLGAVGATGDATGPHLHFEIWPDGWCAAKTSQPIDPLPQLEAWTA